MIAEMTQHFAHKQPRLWRRHTKQRVDVAIDDRARGPRHGGGARRRLARRLIDRQPSSARLRDADATSRRTCHSEAKHDHGDRSGRVHWRTQRRGCRRRR